MVLVLITGVAAVDLYRLYVPRHYPVPKLSVTGTSERVARGQHLAFILCTGCPSLSGGRLPLSGGQDLIRSANLPPRRRFVPPDRTPGGPPSGWSNAQIAQAIRDGVDPGGQVLPVTAAAGDARCLGDADLRHQPAVSKTTASKSISFLGLLPRLWGVSRPRSDGRHRVAPHDPNLTTVVPRWSFREFAAFMGSAPDPMDRLRGLDKLGLEALYRCLHGLGPVRK